MTVPHVQTQKEIESLLGASMIRPNRRLGQNFLIDGNLMRRLVEAGEIHRNDIVLEVGGGTGGLTDLLVTQADRVICVEFDRKLQTILADRFRDVSGFQLICGDVLEQKHRLNTELTDRLGTCETQPSGQLKLIANLPYQIAAPLLTNLLIGFPNVRRFCFTVQAEVGERIMAKPDCKTYGPLSILLQTLCTIQLVAKVPAHVFWPQPKVDSVIIRMDVKKQRFSDAQTDTQTEAQGVSRFAHLVRHTFDHRRKVLRKALSYVLDEAQIERLTTHFDLSRRPESLSVEEWLHLDRVIYSEGESASLL